MAQRWAPTDIPATVFLELRIRMPEHLSMHKIHGLSPVALLYISLFRRRIRLQIAIGWRAGRHRPHAYAVAGSQRMACAARARCHAEGRCGSQVQGGEYAQEGLEVAVLGV